MAVSIGPIPRRTAAPPQRAPRPPHTGRVAGPEYLADDRPRPGPARSWAVVAIVVVVLAGLLVVRVRQPSVAPAPGPTAPTAGPASPSRTWPVGVGLAPGTLFVSAAGRVHVLDVGSGLLTSTQVAVDPVHGALVPIGNGVLVLPHNGRPRQLLLVYGSAGYPVPGALRKATSFLPGSDGSVWAATTDPAEPAAPATTS